MPRTRAKASRKKPAGARRAGANGRPFLSGFVYGAIAGAVVALAVVYYPGELPSVDIPLADSGVEDATVPTVEFEFMYRLPRERVVTNVEPLQRPSDTVAEVVGDTDPGMEYLLQAAAFRGRNEADAMRARLILATNMTAQIESARDPAGGTWHRVLVGPFASRAEMRRTLATLQEMDVSPVALERPKG
ncbi:MAG: SPOR domain-containing protein [Acidobacteria bacterium]|nr:SPOR domain-containing protein [Acidobacteriota bacterium]